MWEKWSTTDNFVIFIYKSITLQTDSRLKNPKQMYDKKFLLIDCSYDYNGTCSSTSRFYFAIDAFASIKLYQNLVLHLHS